MSSLLLIYILLMLGGVAWLGYRILLYVRNERHRESVIDYMADDEQFEAYLQGLKRSQDDKGAPVAPEQPSQRPVDRPKPQPRPQPKPAPMRKAPQGPQPVSHERPAAPRKPRPSPSGKPPGPAKTR